MLAVRDRPFTVVELERLRLLLSTFRDGSAQYLRKIDAFMPDYLAFERATAIVCGGQTTENKGIFDVVVPGGRGELPFGVSCKMAVAQTRNRSWFMELSNSAKKFHDALEEADIDWKSAPELSGPLLISVVERWHHAAEDVIDVPNSKYLVLVHDKPWTKFRIVCLDLGLRRADPMHDVRWTTTGRNPASPSMVRATLEVDGRSHCLWQFYARSGGQLKFFPLIDWAEWCTEWFRLESPPVRPLRDKVDEYWPRAWP